MKIIEFESVLRALITTRMAFVDGYLDVRMQVMYDRLEASITRSVRRGSTRALC
jgi:hypothetical protein